MNNNTKSVLLWGSILVIILVLLYNIEPRDPEEYEDPHDYLEYLDGYSLKHKAVYLGTFIVILGMMWLIADSEADVVDTLKKRTARAEPQEYYPPPKEYDEAFHDGYSVKRFKVDENRPR